MTLKKRVLDIKCVSHFHQQPLLRLQQQNQVAQIHLFRPEAKFLHFGIRKRREGRTFSPCHSQHQVVKTDRRVEEVWLHTLLASASEGGKWSVSHPIPFSPRRLKCTISRLQVSYLFIVTIDI